MCSLRDVSCGLVVAALISFFSAASAAPLKCENVSCDCDRLTEQAIVSGCKQRETTLINQCKESSGSKVGFCAAHGPKATRTSLTINTHSFSSISSESATFNEALTAAQWTLEDYVKSAQYIDDAQPKIAKVFARKLSNALTHFHELQMRRYLDAVEDSARAGRNQLEDDLDEALERQEALDSLIADTAATGQLHQFLLAKALADNQERIAHLYSLRGEHAEAANAFEYSAQLSIASYAAVLDLNLGLARSEIKLALGRFNAAAGEFDLAGNPRRATSAVAARDREQSVAIQRMAAAQ